QTAVLQKGYYLKYLIFIFITISILLGLAFFQESWPGVPQSIPLVEFYEWIIVGFMIVATLVAPFAKSLIGSVLLLGVVGYGVALLFVIYGAPDLALTQFMIETLTIIMISLIAIKFPKSFSQQEFTRKKIPKIILACVFGLSMTTILWSVMNTPFDS